MSSLKELKPGDKVLITYSVCIGWTSMDNYREEEIERITPSGLIVVCGAKFSSDTGTEKTSGKRRYITTMDDEKALKTMEVMNKKIEINDVCNKMNMLKREQLSYEQAVEIKKIMGWENET